MTAGKKNKSSDWLVVASWPNGARSFGVCSGHVRLIDYMISASSRVNRALVSKFPQNSYFNYGIADLSVQRPKQSEIYRLAIHFIEEYFSSKMDLEADTSPMVKFANVQLTRQAAASLTDNCSINLSTSIA